MDKIIRGIHDFQETIFSEHQELFERLSAGQTPETLFITCSDSRVDPSLLTQTKPGELFILRNAGNIIPPWGAAHGGEGATIEYAVRALGVKDIIVCGHTHCGAMAGLFDSESLKNLPTMKRWLEYAETTASIVRDKYGDESGEELLTDAIKENVLCQIDNLRTHPAVASGLSNGSLKVHGWVYRFETGDVYAFQPRAGKFLPVSHPPEDRLGFHDAPTI